MSIISHYPVRKSVYTGLRSQSKSVKMPLTSTRFKGKITFFCQFSENTGIIDLTSALKQLVHEDRQLAQQYKTYHPPLVKLLTTDKHEAQKQQQIDEHNRQIDARRLEAWKTFLAFVVQDQNNAPHTLEQAKLIAQDIQKALAQGKRSPNELFYLYSEAAQESDSQNRTGRNYTIMTGSDLEDHNQAIRDAEAEAAAQRRAIAEEHQQIKSALL